MGDRWGSASGPGCGVILPKTVGSCLRWKHACRTRFGSDGDLDTVEQRKVVIDLETWRCVWLVPNNLLEWGSAQQSNASDVASPRRRFATLCGEMIKRRSTEKFTSLERSNFQVSEHQGNLEDQKLKIIAETAELSRLLGMIPSDGTIDVHEPMTNNSTELSNWLSATRDSFLRLSLLISKALDIQLQ